MNGYSVFPKHSELLELHHQIVECCISGHSLGSFTAAADWAKRREILPASFKGFCHELPPKRVPKNKRCLLSRSQKLQLTKFKPKISDFTGFRFDKSELQPVTCLLSVSTSTGSPRVLL